VHPVEIRLGDVKVDIPNRCTIVLHKMRTLSVDSEVWPEILAYATKPATTIWATWDSNPDRWCIRKRV
jgi:hypothetical protein